MTGWSLLVITSKVKYSPSVRKHHKRKAPPQLRAAKPIAAISHGGRMAASGVVHDRTAPMAIPASGAKAKTLLQRSWALVAAGRVRRICRNSTASQMTETTTRAATAGDS
jgi:hypothetical protein